MSSILIQLPWIIAWVVVLLFQERFIRQKNWFGSILLIWISLILSFVWDPAVNLLLADSAASLQFGSRFWLLFVITAILHVLGRRKEKKEEKKPKEELQAASDPTEPSEE